MRFLSQSLSYIIPLFYLAVVLLYYSIFMGRKKALELKSAPILISLLIAHALEIATRLFVLRAMPLSTVFDALSFISFSILFIYTIIESSFKNKTSGFFILLFALILKLISSFSYNWEPGTNELLSTPTFAFHAALTVMGYTSISISAIYALMYIIQNRNMKQKNFGIIYRQMPPLAHLELMSIRSVALGIVLLGAGIFLGHIQARNLLGSFFYLDPKVLGTDIVWLIYISGYFLARALKWRGRWMAYLSMSCFFILIMSATLIYFLSETFHKF